MNKGVVYLMAGPGYGLLVAVSLWALRKHYQGPVQIMATEPSDAAFGLTMDQRLDVGITPIHLMTAEGENYRKGQGEFPRGMITKAACHRWTPFDLTLFLDADTLPLADPSLLFDMAGPPWSKVVVLSAREYMNPERVENMGKFCEVAKCTWRRNSLSINTGVMAFWKDAPLMEAALQLAIRGATCCRFVDELAMQALYPEYPHILVTDAWNWSPVWGRHSQPGEVFPPGWRPKIMHSPGGRMTLGKMRQPWLDAFRDAWDSNVGGMKDWGSEEAKRWLAQV